MEEEAVPPMVAACAVADADVVASVLEERIPTRTAASSRGLFQSQLLLCETASKEVVSERPEPAERVEVSAELPL